MIVGVLSDSHGRADRVNAALRLFDRQQVEAIIHCGDVGGMNVFDELAGRTCYFVWGNTDDPDPMLGAYLETVGLTSPTTTPLRLALAGKSIEVFHGHEPEFLFAVSNPRADYIFHGHTHVRRDERVGRTRVINPGALHRAPVYTVATLDIERDLLAFHDLVK